MIRYVKGIKETFAPANNSWESRRDPIQPIGNAIAVICNLLCGWRRINYNQHSALEWKLSQEATDYKSEGGLAENEQMYFYKGKSMAGGLRVKIKEYSMAYSFDTGKIPCIGPRPRDYEGTYHPERHEVKIQSGTLSGVTEADLEQMLGKWKS